MYSLMFIAFVKLEYKETCETEERQVTKHNIVLNEMIDFLIEQSMKSKECEREQAEEQPKAEVDHSI